MSELKGINLAVDLARMPALARSLEEFALPGDVFDVMQVAAAVPEACRSASQETGQPVEVLVQAARFYVQQVLLRPGADPYRVLGLEPGAPREAARRHLGCLLQWLHPDVNQDLDSIYTERVLKAWREVSNHPDTSRPQPVRSSASAKSRRTKRMPWIKQPGDTVRLGRIDRSSSIARPIFVAAAAVFVVVLLFAVFAVQPS